MVVLPAMPMRARRHRSLLISMAALAAALAVRAQTRDTTPQTFRGGVDIVDVDVAVLDQHRLPVTGLTASDFTVYENGKPRPIVAFSAVDLPTRVLPPARWMEDAAPDLATNAVPSEGRLVTILMNRTITAETYPTARAIASAAIEQLAPGDLAAVIFATHGTPQNFTADRRLLHAAIDRPFAILPDGDRGEAGDCYCGTCSLQTMIQVAESLETIRHRRRLMLVIGNNLSVQSNGMCGGALKDLRDRTTDALEAANITVYTIDPSGLVTQASSGANRKPLDPGQQAMANLIRRNNLLYFPDRTGGRAVVGANDPAGAVSELFRESRSYYVLGFQPASLTNGRRASDIDVKVARRGVTLQARRAFMNRAPAIEAPRAKGEPALPAALREAVAGLWPRTDLPLTMSATTWALPGMQSGTAAVVVGVRQPLDADRLARLPADDRTADVVVGAFDRNGRLIASTRETVSNLPAAQDGIVAYEIAATLPLRPGRYEIRAAVDDRQSSRVGSVYGYVEVPDYRATPVSLSGVVLDTVPRSAAIVGAMPPEVLSFVPTTRRTFATTDRVIAFARDQQGLVHSLVPGYLDARILDQQDREVFHHEERLAADAFGANRATNLTLDVPVARLGAGEYLLKVEVRHGNDRASRDVWFSIR